MSYTHLAPRPVGAYQVPFRDQNSYRFMAHRPQRQPLQLLYPANRDHPERLMQNTYTPDGLTIPHLDPSGIQSTREQYIALAKMANAELVSDMHQLGGDIRLLAHPFVEPDSLIEDPSLGYHSMGHFSPAPPRR